MLEADTAVVDSQPEANHRFDVLRIWRETLRVVRYALASTTATLLVATVSARLLRVDEAWHFFLVGALSGLLATIILAGLQHDPRVQLHRPWLLPTGILILTASLTFALGMMNIGIDVNVVGAVMVGLVASALSMFVYQVFDAPESVPGD